MPPLSYEDFVSQVQNRADLARDAVLGAIDAVLVADRSGIEVERAAQVTSAVFSVLQDSLSRAEVSDVKAELPERLKRLLRTPQR
jgi:uncharacterized protein (DUF2267 family)